MFAKSARGARATASPPSPASWVAEHALVADVKLRMIVLVEVIPTVRSIEANKFVVIALREPVEVTLLNLSGDRIFTSVFVVVIIVYAEVELFDLELPFLFALM